MEDGRVSLDAVTQVLQKAEHLPQSVEFSIILFPDPKQRDPVLRQLAA